jgi:hypothetical protein
MSLLMMMKADWHAGIRRYCKKSPTSFEEQMLIYYCHHHNVSEDWLLFFRLGICGTSTAKAIETIATK